RIVRSSRPIRLPGLGLAFSALPKRTRRALFDQRWFVVSLLMIKVITTVQSKCEKRATLKGPVLRKCKSVRIKAKRNSRVFLSYQSGCVKSVFCYIIATRT
uniref:Uncharacterized protein n=1 Tax=Anopheles quadriannulatus TaxID=34691 RepID=A0A182XQH2_ANOQN